MTDAEYLRELVSDCPRPDLDADRLEAIANKLQRMKEALKRIAASDRANMETLHPDACASVASAALKD